MRLWVSSLLFMLGIAGAVALYAHAVLVGSEPAPNARVKGPSFPIVLTFNSRVDQSRSTVTLDAPGQATVSLSIRKERQSPDKLLSSVSAAKPGIYTPHWQVLSIDGHITQGRISFEVQ